eukprot:TRINITY_DN3058_c0_g1_i2.p1 TRINITY_DN3058_c0_g1~~TRINITY_DN3058_c0_g1_i2.p1  ORF type:complete len:206 (-),score=21.56 TRINITY_DN3058_c0_g1_i2:167-784(-)
MPSFAWKPLAPTACLVICAFWLGLIVSPFISPAPRHMAVSSAFYETPAEHDYVDGTVEFHPEQVPEELYSTVMRTMPTVCVDVLLVHNDRLLMIKRSNYPAYGEWWFVGGRMFKGESFFDAAHRIALRETGLKIQPLKVLGVLSSSFERSAREGISTQTINVTVLALALQTDAQADEHHEGARWVELNSLPTHRYWDVCKHRLLS